jgi:hypothetical protein
VVAGLGEIPWYTYVGPFGALAAAISTGGFRDPRKRFPGIRMNQTFGMPRQDWNPVDYAASAQFGSGGYVPLRLPGYEQLPAFSLHTYAQQAPVALSGLGGSMFGAQGPRPVHVAPPQFAVGGVNALLPEVLAQRPGGLLGLGACVSCQPSVKGLGSISIPSSAPPQLYTDAIPPARSQEEALFQQSVAHGTTGQANQAYEDARAQGATHDEAVSIAAPIAQGVARGAGEGILGGIASIVGSILGPLASAGTGIYQSIEQGKLAKEQAKQRQQELLVMQETRRRDQEFAAQQSAQSAAFWGAHGTQIAAGAVGTVLVVGAAAYFLRGGKKKGRRAR